MITATEAKHISKNKPKIDAMLENIEADIIKAARKGENQIIAEISSCSESEFRYAFDVFNSHGYMCTVHRAEGTPLIGVYIIIISWV